MTDMIERLAKIQHEAEAKTAKMPSIDWDKASPFYRNIRKAGVLAILSALEDPSEEMIVAIWPFVCTGDADESYQRNDPVIRAYAKDCIAAAIQSAKGEAET